MPYPNEHAARINNPDKYKSIRRENNKFGQGIDVIWGVPEEGGTEIQAIRFSRTQFTPAQARAWLKRHGYKPIEFEEAEPNTNSFQVNRSQRLQNYVIKEETINNKKHLIVPVVMMTEGVRPGSKGAILHNAENLAASAPDWNGIPVTIHHPKNSEGQYISANTEGITHVGFIRNARVEGTKLLGEACLNEQTLMAASTLAHSTIVAGRQLEVSIGAFTHEVAEAGEYNGVAYEAVTQTYTPDHLALLPGGRGACSWSDGCGIRVNEFINQKNKGLQIMTQEEINARKEATVAHILEIQANEKGLRETVEMVSRIVDSWDGEMAWHSLQEVYPNYFIYRRVPRNRPGIQPTLYKQNYTMSDGSITLQGEPIPVQQNIEYLEMNTNQKSNKKGETEMKKCTPCQVDALLANSLTNLTEVDRPWLLEQSEEIIAKLTPKEPQVNEVEKVVEKEKEYTPEGVAAYISGLEDKNTVFGLLPEVKSALDLRTQRRAQMVEAIMANNKEWSKEELEAMNCNTLQKLVKTATGKEADAVITDYSLNGGKQTEITFPDANVDPMLPTQTY